MGQCSALINTFPYQESFETGTGNWVPLGTNTDWTWGTPTKTIINAAGAGNKCWIAGGLSGSSYASSEASWIQSPCFDLSGIDKPFISVLVFWETEFSYDGANLQYSIDGGSSWSTIGYANEPASCGTDNWYNHPGVRFLNGLTNNATGWSGSTGGGAGCGSGHGSGQWLRASHCVPQVANKPQVIFRFTFGSGTICNNFEGFAFDDFRISSAPVASVDFTYSCGDDFIVNFGAVNTANCLNDFEWNFDDASSLSNSANTEGPIHRFSGAGVYNVTLEASGNCFLEASTSKQVTILDATLTATEVSCEGDSDGSATVNVLQGSAQTSINWNTQPSQISTTASGLPVGEYMVTISDPNGCGLAKAIRIEESPEARPSVELGNDTTLCPGSFFIIKPSTFKTYQWQDGSTDSLFVVSSSGIIKLNVTNINGCQASDSILVVEDCLNDILFPNTFTPNDDGINEFFKAYGSEPSEFYLSIYDRWGELIFQTEDFTAGWDGIFKGHRAEDGLYIFRAVYSIFNSESREKAGSVYLIR